MVSEIWQFSFCRSLIRELLMSQAALSALIMRVLSQMYLLLRMTMSEGWLKVSLGSPNPSTVNVFPSVSMMSLTDEPSRLITPLIRGFRSLSPFSALTATMQSPLVDIWSSVVVIRVVLWVDLTLG